MRRSLLIAAVCVPTLLWMTSADVWAQSLFPGGSGSSRGGSGSSGSSRSGSSGSSSRGGTSGSTAASGQSQFGGVLNLTQDVGSSIGQNSFVGRSNDSGFVGRTNASGTAGRSSSLFGSSNSGLGRQLSGMANPGGGINGINYNQNGVGQNMGQSRPLKPQLQLGFDGEQVVGTELTTVIHQRMTNIHGVRGRIPGVDFRADDTGNVVLTGTVGNERDRRTAEMLVRMEPGVRSVQNNIQVDSQP